MENNNKKIFLSCSVADVEQQNGTAPYALHLEGNLTREPVRKTDKNGRPMTILSLGMGRDPKILAPADAPELAANGDSPFISAFLFGDLAEVAGTWTKGQKIVLSGRPVVRKGQDKDGKEVHNVSVMADNAYALPCRAGDGDPASEAVTSVKTVFNRQDGTTGNSVITTLIPAKVLSPGGVREVNGREVRNFEVELNRPALELLAMANGQYQEGTSYGEYKKLSCSVWGPRASRLGRVLTPGNELLLTGELKAREYNGAEYVDLRVRELSVLKWATPLPADGAAPAPAPVPSGDTPSVEAPAPIEDISALLDDEEDLELPF